MIKVTLNGGIVYHYRDVEHVKSAAIRWAEHADGWELDSEERKICLFNKSRLVVLASRLESNHIDGDAIIRG